MRPVHARSVSVERRSRRPEAALRRPAPAARRGCLLQAAHRVGAPRPEHADRERALASRGPRLLAQAVDGARHEQRALADAARPVEDRQPGRAQVRGDDRGLLRAPEEERRVVLVVRERARRTGSADARRRAARLRSARRSSAPACAGSGSGEPRLELAHVLAQLAVDELDILARVPERLLDLAQRSDLPARAGPPMTSPTSLRAPQIRLRITRRFQSLSE